MKNLIQALYCSGVLLVVLSSAGQSSASENAPMDLLLKIVDINSHNSNKEGIQKVRSLLVPEFQKLGFSYHAHDVEQGHQVAVFDFPQSRPHLALVGHLDTVFPKSSPLQKARMEETRLYGPGVIDMKGGLIVILDILRQLSLEERRKVKVLLNDDEELASMYSRTKIKELAAGIPFGLVFEPGLPGGEVVTSSSGGRWIKLTVTGKAAHAGLEHRKGLNACVELAHKIALLNQLTDYSKNLTLNVGTLQGGTQPNVVCEEASVVLDVRYVNPVDFDGLLLKIQKIADQSTLRNSLLNLSTTVKIETLANVPSLPRPFTDDLFRTLKEAAKKVHQNINGVHVGYATDANHLSETGMKVLVGLGPYGGGMHTDQEFMEIASLKSRSILGLALIQTLLRQNEGEVAKP